MQKTDLYAELGKLSPGKFGIFNQLIYDPDQRVVFIFSSTVAPDKKAKEPICRLLLKVTKSIVTKCSFKLFQAQFGGLPLSVP